jgi:hypothetical protein
LATCGLQCGSCKRSDIQRSRVRFFLFHNNPAPVTVLRFHHKTNSLDRCVLL